MASGFPPRITIPQLRLDRLTWHGFFFLDAYYLGFERLFRKKYDSFVAKLNAKEATAADIFSVTPQATKMETLKKTLTAMTSVAVLPFYGLLAVMLLIVGCLAPALTQ